MDLITVGVFDEHMIFAAGVAAVLADDPTVRDVRVVHADTAPVAQELEEFDVAVMSLPMYRRLDVMCPAVVCVSERDAAGVADMDVAAVLIRDTVTPDQLSGAVHASAAGLRVAARRIADARLDDRTRSVLRMLAEGAGTREISERLGYSERTIKGTIQQAQRQLGARTRAQAVALALRTAAI